jgi:dTDP-4-amino-4,6-dideoxygalactose transaminase/acetyltransferase-like isoleucine patch superfamily enzyme
MTPSPKQSIRDVKLGQDVRIFDFVNLYECEIGDNSRIGTFVEIQRGATIGRSVKVSSHTFICEGVTIEDGVFIGHNVSFINDKYPRATTNGRLQTDADWQCVPTLVKRGASIGTSATILCGVTIGEGAIVGAGSVVTKDVPDHAVVAGVPARLVRHQMRAEVVAASPPSIPFLDLRAQYRSIREEVRAAVDGVLESGVFVLGAEVEAFEREYAAYCGTEHAIAVNSGTSALHLALLAAGVGPGDEVITVPFTFVATVAAIQYAGARPILIDVEPVTLTMDVTRLEGAITPRTKAVVPVHLYGQPADMAPIVDVARRRGLAVIEDAAQAHGAEYHGRRAGAFGEFGCFSFYPGKNLGAYGEGGIIVTGDAGHARRLRTMRDWGQDRKYHHAVKGYNYRMDALQAAVLRVKLRHLEAWTEARRTHAGRYDTLLADADLHRVPARSGARHVYHVYAIRSGERDGLQQALDRQGIRTGIHYPIPVHLQPAYRDLGYHAGDFPQSEAAAREVLSLPMFPELTAELQGRVVEAICRGSRT